MLRNPRAVMVWRAVSDLERTRQFVDTTLRWSLIGDDEHTLMYDAGGAVAGFSTRWNWSRSEAIQREEDRRSGRSRAATIPRRLMNDEACGGIVMNRFDLVANPASALTLGSNNIRGPVRRVATALNRRSDPTPTTTATGETLSVMQDDGNVFAFVQPSSRALAGRAGNKVRALYRNRGLGDPSPARRAGGGPAPSAADAETPTPLLGLRLLVSDLKESSRYYRQVVGLPRLRSARQEATFDAGSIVLTLEPEAPAGLVQVLDQSNRFSYDWIVYHVDNIEQAVDSLLDSGADPPAGGIETSTLGSQATFRDPDGHPYSVWQPSGQPGNIDFYPVLRRILAEQA